MATFSLKNRQKRTFSTVDWRRGHQTHAISDEEEEEQLATTIYGLSAPKKLRRASESPSSRNQIYHRELERQRRRELSILYEFNRQCITPDDVSQFSPGTETAVDKLSQLEILRIITFMTKDAVHEAMVSKHLKRDIRRLEFVCRKFDLPLDSSPPELSDKSFHQEIAAITADTLNKDRK